MCSSDLYDLPLPNDPLLNLSLTGSDALCHVHRILQTAVHPFTHIHLSSLDTYFLDTLIKIREILLDDFLHAAGIFSRRDPLIGILLIVSDHRLVGHVRPLPAQTILGMKIL